jgi:hypothetical protein
MPVQFTVTIANFSSSERRNVRITVKVNGAERLEASLPLASVPPGHTSGTFQVSFNQLGFNEITANLEDEEAGLQADNVRYAALEVRRQVPILIVDGDLTSGDKPGGDLYHLRTLFTAARGFDVVRGGVAELERPNLEQYPSLFLLNVRDLNERAVKNLEAYVQEGGAVAFFLGDRVNSEFYNKRLYAAGKGIFPAPLAEKPTPALSEEERQSRVLQNLADPAPQLLIRKPDHPIFTEVSAFKDLFQFLSIERHYQVPRQKWDFDPNRTEELATLPNDRPLTDYQGVAQDIVSSLPIDDSKFGKYRAGLEARRRALHEALAGKSLQPLITAIDKLLQDPAEPGRPERPRLKDFWLETDAQVQALRGRLEKLRERLLYGDPLVVSSRYGRGRSVAFFTSAGKAWNDWAGGGPASVTYPVVMLDLQKYLTGVEAEDNRLVGTPLEIQADSARYESRLRCFVQRDSRDSEPAKPDAPSTTLAAGLKDLGEQVGSQSGNLLTFVFDKGREPGVYRFQMTQRSESTAPKPEERAYAFNVDTSRESDLRRSARDELSRVGKLTTPATVSFVELIGRPTDLSESPWIYLVILVLLLAEQGLAVRLSHHLDREERGPGPLRREQPAAA